MKKKWITTLGLACAVMIGASMTACANTEDGQVTNTPDAQEEQASLCSFVSIDINPSIELTLDSKDVVLSVYGANEDGEILLYEEKDALIGVDLNTAVEKITTLAKELGYFEENSVVNTTVTSDSEEKEQEIFDKINAKIIAKGNELGLSLRTQKEHVFSLLRQYEEFLENNNLTEQDLTIEKYKLALSASQSGEITIEAALELNEQELIQIIHETHEKAKDFATQELHKQHQEKMAEIDKLMAEAVSSEYVEYFISKGDFVSAYNSLGYGVYSAYYHGLNVLEKTVSRAEDLRKYPLSEDAVANIMTVLQIEDVELIQGHDGEVTIASIERYANRIIKNMTDEQTAQALSDALATELANAEEQLELAAEEEIAKHAPRIQEIVDKVNNVISSIDLSAISPVADILAQDVIAMNEKLLQEIENGLTSEKLREYAEEMKAKADQAYENIKTAIQTAGNDLENRVTVAKDNLGAERERINNHINELKNDVHNRIEGLKNQFKNGDRHVA